MHSSPETPEQAQARLSRVLAEAEFVVHDGAYAFVETGVARFPAELIPAALAFVRDEDVWSALVPSTAAAEERFTVFAFHFTPGAQNSGFTGWLASHLKARVGTGVLVICGQNSKRGGIFDYWGAPTAAAGRVIAEIERMRAQAKSG